MSEQNELTVSSLMNKVAEMESDMKTTIRVFADMMKSLGIEPKNFEKGVDVMALLPTIIGTLSRKLAIPGGFDTKSFAEVQAIMPIFEKYKHLAADLNENEDDVKS